MASPIRVGITHGDINGIGYEVVLKAVSDEKIPELFTPVFYGSPQIVEKARREFNLELLPLHIVKHPGDIRDGKLNIVEIDVTHNDVEPGLPTEKSGKAAVQALELACEALERGDIQVLVTAPISKKAVQSDEFQFPGHTEYLQERLGSGSHALMVLFNDLLKVALVTTHLPLSKVPQAITRERVFDQIRSFEKVLKSDFTCERPKIAVLSLNPHCGDEGLLGNEENDEIIPALEDAKKAGILAFGPYSADGFFSTDAYRNFDGILAMYHDQGLAPFKALAGDTGVNFTGGLPFIRTSPDHGTAYDLAWKDKADPTSMRQAIYKAIDLYRNRMEHQKAAANPLRKVRTERGADKTVDLTKEEITD
ncbi:MAG: 4-hydroxythreonine-4-phosphate dehydrogenase PdxA [Muribaculaceae bacterium]|nr:4-hydroxythreonine-4-phosphate dehydrogenase PdxA [Bacteroides sp.]MDE6072023.1 4-hydroxythreonine-4-phosphate dehydrogenase PdxA [Muribaculaceae bacterium]